MQGTLLALLFILVPLLLVIFLRTNAVMMFFVLSGTYTLQSNLDENVMSFAGSIFGKANTSMVSLIILSVPFIVTAFAFKNSIASKGLALHGLISLGAGLSFFYLVAAYLPGSLRDSVQNSQAYGILQPFTSVVITATFLLSIILLWLNRSRHEHHKKHGH